VKQNETDEKSSNQPTMRRRPVYTPTSWATHHHPATIGRDVELDCGSTGPRARVLQIARGRRRVDDSGLKAQLPA